MKVNINSLVQYLRCPLSYKFRYLDRIKPEKRYIVYNAYEQALKQMAYHIFYLVQNGTYPSNRDLKITWGRIWAPNLNKQTITSMVTQRKGRKNSNIMMVKEFQGLDAVLKMGEKFRKNPGYPILIAKSFIVDIGHHQIQGTIDLLREVNNNLQLVDFRYTYRRNEYHARKLFIKNDVQLTLASLAVQQLLNAKEYHVACYLTPYEEMLYNRRNQQDYENLEKLLDKLEIALRNNIYYPVVSDSCIYCSFKKHCHKTKWY